MEFEKKWTHLVNSMPKYKLSEDVLQFLIDKKNNKNHFSIKRDHHNYLDTYDAHSLLNSSEKWAHVIETLAIYEEDLEKKRCIDVLKRLPQLKMIRFLGDNLNSEKFPKNIKSTIEFIEACDSEVKEVNLINMNCLKTLHIYNSYNINVFKIENCPHLSTLELGYIEKDLFSKLEQSFKNQIKSISIYLDAVGDFDILNNFPNLEFLNLDVECPTFDSKHRADDIKAINESFNKVKEIKNKMPHLITYYSDINYLSSDMIEILLSDEVEIPHDLMGELLITKDK